LSPGVKTVGTALKLGPKWLVTIKSLTFTSAFNAVLFGWIGVAVVIGTVAHEMGHYLACRVLGVPARTPVFMPFTSYVEHVPVPPDVEALIAAAGPFSGSLAGLLLLPFSTKAAAVVGAVQLFNLIPFLPFLDGAKILRGITEVTIYSVIAIVVAGVALIVSSFETALWFLG